MLFRSGGKDLKRTQVYPRGYGVRIQALQDDLRDCLYLWCFPFSIRQSIVWFLDPDIQDTKRNYLQACIKKACSKMKQKGVKPATGLKTNSCFFNPTDCANTESFSLTSIPASFGHRSGEKAGRLAKGRPAITEEVRSQVADQGEKVNI